MRLGHRPVGLLARVTRRVWYAAFGLPELRAYVWLQPSATPIERLLGRTDRTIARIEIPADLSYEERRKVLQQLRDTADSTLLDLDVFRRPT